MRVDEAGHDQPAARVDYPVGRLSVREGGPKTGSDAGDARALDQDVEPPRTVAIAVMVVDQPAFDENPRLCHPLSRGRCSRAARPPRP